MLVSLDDKRNRVTLFNNFNYAFRNLYSDNYNYIPDPVLGDTRNNAIRFYSRTPGQAIVDWGDGTTETFDFIESTVGYYVCSWRSWEITYIKNPTSLSWGLGNNVSTGEIIVPYDNHHYTDDTMIERKIVMTFTTDDIYEVSSPLFKMNKFPIIELDNLTSLTLQYMSYVNEIPIDRLVKMKSLKGLNVHSMGSRLQILPSTFFEMTKLESINFGNGLDLDNVDASNIRMIKNLTNLKTLNIGGCNLEYYIKEFNDLPNLYYLDMVNRNIKTNILPNMSEVATINPTLQTWDVLHSVGRTTWGDISGKGLDKLTYWSAYDSNSISLDLPQYLKEMRNLNNFNMSLAVQSQLRSDTFVDNFYTYVTTWDKLTKTNTATDGLRNQFYSLFVNIYNGMYPRDYRPSGVLQAPTGFIEGISDGLPSTPLEKVYVLQKNYKQNWNMKPA